MINHEITYRITVSYFNGKWHAHGYLDADGDDNNQTFNNSSIWGPGEALRRLANSIEEWELKNVEPYKSAIPE